MAPIKILIADDHAVLRDSLAAFLGLYPELEIIGQAADGLEAIDQAMRLQPDVLLLDIGMPNLGGLEVTQRLKRDLPGCKIVILSQYHDPDYVLPLLKAGVAQTVLETSVRGQQSWTGSQTVLTDREREVLVLIGEGKTNQEIARILSISRKTVDKHRANLMEKLQVNSRAELIRYAVEQKIIPSNNSK